MLIHDNLPRVHKEIKTWNLNLRTSARYLTHPTTTTPDEEADDAGSSADEPDPEEAANSSMADMFEDISD